MPHISIRRGETVVRLYDGERNDIKRVLAMLAGARPHLQANTARAASEAEKALLTVLSDIPERPKRAKKAAAAA